MIHLTDGQSRIVTEIVAQRIPDRRVVAFGSRVDGNPKPFSDLDLAIYGNEPLPLTLLGQLRDDFSESSLPFRVDLVDANAISDEFRQIIEKKHEIIQA